MVWKNKFYNESLAKNWFFDNENVDKKLYDIRCTYAKEQITEIKGLPKKSEALKMILRKYRPAHLNLKLPVECSRKIQREVLTLAITGW
jgi:hypothetical protein